MTSAPTENDNLDPNPASSPKGDFVLEENASETPTTPPSPTVSPSVPDARPIPRTVDELAAEKAAKEIVSKPRVIHAEEPRCAKCHWSLNKFSSKERAAHINACWKPLVQAAQKGYQKKPVITMERAAHRKLVKIYVKPGHSPKAAPGATPSSTDEGLRHICMNCKLDVIDLDTVTAFGHRLECTRRLPPVCCFACKQSFKSRRWRDEDLLAHILECQSNDESPSPSKDEFNALAKAWQGRKEMVNKRVKPKKTKHAKERVASYKKRRDIGRRLGRGKHAAAPSPLRESSVRKEEGIEVTFVEDVMRHARLNQIRSHQHTVLRLPRGQTLAENWRAEVRLTMIEQYAVEKVPLKLVGHETDDEKAKQEMGDVLKTMILKAKKTGPKGKKKKKKKTKASEASPPSSINALTKDDLPPTSPKNTESSPLFSAPSSSPKASYSIADLVSTLDILPNPTASTNQQASTPNAVRSATVPISPKKDSYTIADLASSLVQPKAPSPKDQQASTAPTPPKRPVDLLALSKRPPIPAGKILKTTSFTLAEERLVPPRTVERAPDTRLTCHEKFADADEEQISSANRDLMNCSPRYYTAFSASPKVTFTANMPATGTGEANAHLVYCADGRSIVFRKGTTRIETTSPSVTTRHPPSFSHLPGLRLPSYPSTSISFHSSHHPLPQFLCTDELNELPQAATFHDPVRGLLAENLRSRILMDRTGGVGLEEVARRAREACVFGGMDEME